MASEPGLGAQFRALRTARGLSLSEVARATDNSVSFLSLFENGKTDITFSRLARLVAFFNIPITDLMPDPEPEQSVVVRRRARRRLESSSEHATIEFLTHDTHHALAPRYVTLEPGGVMMDNPPGGDLFLYVLRGQIEVSDAPGTLLRLRAGDAAYLHRDRTRTFRNRGRSRAELIAVSTMPGF